MAWPMHRVAVEMNRRWWLLVIPIGHALLFTLYFVLGGDPAGTVMSLIFAGALAVLGFSLLPTLGDVGPTAPVDPEWSPEEQRRHSGPR